jgi:hypothetical protein
MEILHPCFNKL